MYAFPTDFGVAPDYEPNILHLTETTYDLLLRDIEMGQLKTVLHGNETLTDEAMTTIQCQVHREDQARVLLDFVIQNAENGAINKLKYGLAVTSQRRLADLIESQDADGDDKEEETEIIESSDL